MRLSCNPVVPSRLGDPHLPNERLERPEVRHVRRLSKGSDEDATNWVADACSALAVSQRRSGHAGHSPLSDSPPQQSRGAGGTRATANGTSEPQLVNSSPLRESRRVQAEAFANGVPNMAEGENGHSRRRLSAVNVLWERLTSSRFSVSGNQADATGDADDAIDIQAGGGASHGAATVTRAPAARAATLAALDTVVQGDLANSHFGAMPIEPPPSAQSPPSSSPAPIHRGA